MAAWNIGPFDNDDAVDWCARLEAAQPDQRARLVGEALAEAARGLPDVDVDVAARGIAAAATTLQSLTDTQRSESPYAPRFLLGQGDIEVTPELRDLAVEAIAAVTSEGSSWRRYWADSVEADDALAMAREIQTELARQRL